MYCTDVLEYPESIAASVRLNLKLIYGLFRKKHIDILSDFHCKKDMSMLCIIVLFVRAGLHSDILSYLMGSLCDRVITCNIDSKAYLVVWQVHVQVWVPYASFVYFQKNTKLGSDH